MRASGRSLELVEAIRVVNSEEQDALQKAAIVVDVPIQTPATDLESVHVVTGDVSMNNAVISDNIDATKKTADARPHCPSRPRNPEFPRS